MPYYSWGTETPKAKPVARPASATFKPPRFRDDEMEHYVDGTQMITVRSVDTGIPVGDRRYKARLRGVARNPVTGDITGTRAACGECNHPFAYYSVTERMWRCECCGSNQIIVSFENAVVIAWLRVL